MDNEQKMCIMCRKEIDKKAAICPYCRSESNYHHSIEIPSNQVVKKEGAVNKVVFVIGSTVAAAIFGLLGLAFGGFWVWFIFAFVAMSAITSWSSKKGITGCDALKITCPGCGNIDTKIWESDSLKQNKLAASQCVSCNQITQLKII